MSRVLACIPHWLFYFRRLCLAHTPERFECQGRYKGNYPVELGFCRENVIALRSYRWIAIRACVRRHFRRGVKDRSQFQIAIFERNVLRRSNKPVRYVCYLVCSFSGVEMIDTFYGQEMDDIFFFCD